MYLLNSYDESLQYILDNGKEKKDRTGVGCISVAGMQNKYDLTTEYFPIVTRRKVFPKSVFAELLWFISGSTLNKDLENLGAKFWSKWCDENNPKYVALRKKWNYLPGDFGPIYGWQLRNFGADYIKYRNYKNIAESISKSNKYEIEYLIELSNEEKNKGFDQLKYIMNILQNDPFGENGRRCLFDLWNPCDMDKMSLPPCHFCFQLIPDSDGYLTGIMTQRSCDFPVGVPANIQFYSALTIMISQQCNMKAKELIHNTNDCHIYINQIELVKDYLLREKPFSPKLKINKAKDIYSYQMTDFILENYSPLDKLDIPVAV